MAISSVKRTDNTQQTQKKEETQQTQEKTQAKSADVNSTNPSARAQDIQRNGEIKDGVFKSRSDATVGDIAQANAMKEDGTVDPAEVKQGIAEMVKNNPELSAKAKELGIDLENPTEEDLQKLANLDVKAGQEVKCPEKAQEAKAPEEAAEEAPAEEAKEEQPQGNCNKAEEAKGAEDKKQGDDPLSQIMDLIQKAEQAQDPSQKAQLANQAIQMINQLRAEKGIQKEDGQQQQAQGTQGQQNGQTQQLVNTIKSGGQVDKAALSQALEGGDKGQLAQILDALEARANQAKNGNNTMLNALNLQGQNNMNQLGLNIQLPYTNTKVA